MKIGARHWIFRYILIIMAKNELTMAIGGECRPVQESGLKTRRLAGKDGALWS